MQTPLRKKFGAVLLAAALFIGLCPLPGRAAATPGGARVADADTRNSYMENLGGADSTLLDGRIWSDKSVSTESLTFTGDAGSITVENDADFLVTYSALATSTQLIQETTAPVDIVFILDFSASMAWGQYENGAGTVTDQAGSRVQAMVDAVNNAIGALVAADPRSRVGIVCFNRGAQTMLDLTAVTPRPDGDYLEITRWNATPGADDGNRGNVQVTCNINSATLPLDSYTNIHAGLFAGMQMLARATDLTVEINGEDVTRVPNVILMSDGAPTTFSAASGGGWWQGITNTPIGTGDNSNPHSGNGFLPLVTAGYLKQAITDHYYPNPAEGQAARVYTIGFMTSQQSAGMSAMADLVLNPAAHWNAQNAYTATGVPQVDAVNTAWQDYHAGGTPDVQYTTSQGPQNYAVDQAPGGAPASVRYNDAYCPADDADDLWNAFNQIINSITSAAKGPTEVTDNDPVHSGYILYNDPLGPYMELKSLQAVIWAGVEFRLEDGFAPAAEPQPDGTTRWVYTGHLETADGGKTFDSPVYGRGNIDDILITLIGEADGTQRLRVAVPASAIPIRVNTVTLNAEQEPIDNVSNNAYPLRVCYTVGLQADAQNPDGTLNTAAGGVSESYLAAHTVDGQVLFYSNLYTGQVQGQDTVGEATVQFSPADSNPFYFIQQDTPLYLDPACTIRADDPTFDTARDYYFQDAYYAGFGEAVEARTYVIRRQGQNLADSVARDAGGWYIEKDAARLGNLTDLIRLKGDGNRTDTAAAAIYPTFVGEDAHTGWFLGYLGNNGRLALAAPASLTIAKAATAAEGLTPPAIAAFPFTLRVPAKANQTVAATRRFADGSTAGQTLRLDAAGEAQFSLPAGEALTIPAMQGLAFTVTETGQPAGFTLETAQADPADIGRYDPGAAAFAGTVGTADATVAFTNRYTAVFPAGDTVEIPVVKQLAGLRTDWQAGERYTFAIAPSERADNNPNAALLLTNTELTLDGGSPSGAFTLDLAPLTAARNALAAAPETPAPATPETAPLQPAAAEPTATGETARARRSPPLDAAARLAAIPGEYYYTITETGGVGPGDITFDRSRYEACVTVTDDGAGRLAAALTSLVRVAGPDGGALANPEPAAQAVFVNTTAALPTPTPEPTLNPEPTQEPTEAPGPTLTPTPEPGAPTATPGPVRPTAAPTPATVTNSGPTASPAPAAGQGDVPPTGDALPALPLALLAAASAAALALLVYRRSRR